MMMGDSESGERIIGNLGDSGLGELDYGKVEGGGCWGVGFLYKEEDD
uniref:Uncharacterized protein n=1 Tax=Cucumis melo TaxID=3656 RepID=A0A9I9EIG4_CUCME